jgi:stringent starvation protein B
MLPNRPYLLRAMYDWIVDSGCTPHLLIDADDPNLQVPDAARQDGKVVLNISPMAVRDLLMEDDLVTFVARFGGVSQSVSAPMSAVQAVYARENGRGMLFPEDDELDASEDNPRAQPEPSSSDVDDGDNVRPSKPNLRVVK